MERAHIGVEELSQRTGFSRSKIYNLLNGTTKPKEQDLEKIREGLRHVTGEAVVTIEDHDYYLLQKYAGFVSDAVSDNSMNRVQLVDQCHVYSTMYARSAFPTKWSLRLLQTEQESPGSIYIMTDHPVNASRPPDYYERSYHRESYDPALVDLHSGTWRQYLNFFKEEILSNYEIRHIYQLDGFRRYILGEAQDWRDRTIPSSVRKEQLEVILHWIQERKVEVGFTTRTTPANFKVLGSKRVFIEFPQRDMFLRVGNVLGLEITGSDAVDHFLDQFKGIWKLKETIKDIQEVEKILQELLDTEAMRSA